MLAPKRFGKKTIIILICVCALAIGVLAYFFLYEKSAKRMYLEAELKSAVHMGNTFEELFGAQWDRLLKQMKEPSSTRNELTADVYIQGIPIMPPGLSMLRAAVREGALNINVDVDPRASKTATTSSFSMGGLTLANAQLVESEQRVGLKVPIVYDQFLYLERDRFGEFMRTFYPAYVGPEQYPHWSEAIALLEEYNDELEEMSKHVMRSILFDLDSEYFSHDPESNQVSLVLSEAEIKDFLLRYLTDVSAEDVHHFHFPDGFTSQLTLDRRGNIVHREMQLTIVDAEGEGFRVEVNGDQQYEGSGQQGDTELRLTPVHRVGQFVLHVQSHVAEEEEGTRYAYQLGFTFENEKDSFAVNVDTHSVHTENESGFDVTQTDFELHIMNVFSNEDFALSGHVQQTVNQDLAADQAHIVTEVDIDIASYELFLGQITLGLLLNVDTQTEFHDALDFPQFGAEDRHVVDMRALEWMQFLTEIKAEFEDFVQPYRGLFDF